MNKQIERIKRNSWILKQSMITASFIIFAKNIFSQNIDLSNGIGRVDYNYSYGKLVETLGNPDSIYSFNPGPNSKSLARTELYYDKKMFVVSFFHSVPKTLTLKTSDPDIELYNGSSITLNGDSLSILDSGNVVKKYGPPKSIYANNNEMTIDYDFSTKKDFLLMTFYYNGNRILKKIRILFGRY